MYTHYVYVMYSMCCTVYTCLHGDREVGLSLRREVDIDGFLGEWLVALGRRANFNDVKLCTEKRTKKTSF